ncbi:uncharacterized protein LOC116175091 isoform X3 [Photinus pyralis]|uniref:uncharacterized protein LOC116175091 isoform X3 n=1 Tax=Photinus pyralis TaxID=7054 RepID=UPI00126708CF|nr:uncharacterized protein LOC116175091 isoform X3 [Photinus pyralis]
MAAVAEMGEVDEIHSNEESIRDGASVNGDVCEFNKEADEDPDEIIESTNVSEDEMVEHEENNSDNDDDDAQFREIHSVEEQEVDDDDDEDKMEVEEIGSVEQIHEINNSDDEDKHEEIRNGLDDGTGDSDKMDDANSIIIHDSGEADCDDVVILDDTDPIENGTIDMTEDDVEITEPIEDLEPQNDTDTQANKKKLVSEQVAFRRSIRNFGKERRSYAKKEKPKPPPIPEPQPCDSSDMSDIEEILPEDPLAVIEATPSPQTKAPKKKSRLSSSTIVVKDTKRLAEIASKSTANNNNKKEPTLVIIDTNSILSGRGPIPITQKASMSNSQMTNSFPMLPMALPAQGIYPANMRATITPIPMTPTSISAVPATRPPTTAPTLPPAPPVLPTLTDDMFVVEAPSFIVPYVYEKPPLKDLKTCIKTLENEIKESEESDKAKESESKKEDAPESDKKDDDADKDESNKEGSDVELVNEKQEGKDFELDLPVMPIPNTANALAAELRKPATYFDSALGKFFMGIGYGLVQESVQTDLLKQQKRKRDRENWENAETIKTINSLIKNLEYTKENNVPYRMPTKKCEYCSFKTESSLAMSFHLETPHMKNYVYRCNFCTYEVRSPHDILFHMEVKHGVRGRLERAPAFHQCPNCPFEDNQKGKLSRHSVACMRKFKPERNLEPPADFEPPAKIPRMPRMKQQGMGSAAAVYQAMRGRGRPSMGLPITKHIPPSIRPANANILYKPSGSMSGGSVLVPTNYQLSGNPLYQVVGGPEMGGHIGHGLAATYLPNLSTTPNSFTVQQQQAATNKTKTTNQPSISITPLPRGTTATGLTVNKPGDTNPKNSFVICEICDGYIKDLEQLRNHMQWIHKVKIHPKMIYNRPPLNCQKCQFRFFTDQGLERHLLGSHGLVTSSMQEAANRSKDAGRCPVCGRVYQWKLLNHVGRDHNMTLKPAHLSYKCTVCTATFGMYKQFENHVYSAHSVVTKRVVDKKGASPASSTGSSKSESVLKPLKINDEITIIPQPAKSTNGDADDCGIASTSGLSATSVRASNGNSSASKGEC